MVSPIRTLLFDNQTFSFNWWRNQQLRGTAEKPVSLDLETEKILPARSPVGKETEDDVPMHPLHVPRPVLGMAFDGDQLVLIHPSRLPAFLQAHRGQHLGGWNLAFDVSVILHHCGVLAREAIWNLGDSNRLHDGMLLDMLLQLGTGVYRHNVKSKAGEDAKIFAAGLGAVSEELGCGTLDKNDLWRTSFGKLLGLSEVEMDAFPEVEGGYKYALGDAIATWRVYPLLRQKALDLMKKAGWSPKRTQKTFEIRPDAVDKWGPLGEAIQVKGSIALAELSRTHLLIDQQTRTEMEADARERYHACLDTLLEREPGLVKRYKEKARAGVTKKTKKSALPQFDQKKLVEVLESEARRLNVDILKSDGKLKGTSTSAKVWARLADRSEFITAWKELENTAKLLEFLTGLDAEKVWSRYNLLMRTGRTSAGAYKDKNKPLIPSLNVQQIPRPDKDDPLKSVRNLVKADPGHLLYTVDVVYAELRTLAASCVARFGYSKLSDTIKDHTLHGGLDPHERATLSTMGITEEEFRSKPKDVKKKLRQNTKPISFGVPGGLGPTKIVVLAQSNYGVTLTKAEAKTAKEKFLEAYPEIRVHLADHTPEALAYNLNLPRQLVPSVKDFQKIRWSRWMRKEGVLTEGELNHFWEYIGGLIVRAGREDLYGDVENRVLTRKIENLFLYRAGTLTGLVRGAVNYSQGANLPMQSMCSSACKEVLWRLLRRGYKTKIYLHDEFVIQVPERRAEFEKKNLDRLINDALVEVIGMGIPSAVEGGLAKTWQKV